MSMGKSYVLKVSRAITKNWKKGWLCIQQRNKGNSVQEEGRMVKQGPDTGGLYE